MGLLLWRLIPGGPAVPAIAGSAASLVIAILVLAEVEKSPGTVHESAVFWTPTGGIPLALGTRIDGLAAVVAVMVAVVALLVQKASRSEEHTSELQSHVNLVCRLLL